jgi:hypothetical protein
MQIYQPLEPDDFALIEGKEVSRDEVVAFCGAFTGKEKSSCWSEAWPLFSQEVLSPGGAYKHCSRLEEDSERCFSSLLFVVPTQLGFDPEKIAAYCAALPKDQAVICYAQAASRFIETDYKFSERSVDMCVRAAAVDKEGKCWNELIRFSAFNFHKGSEDWARFCKAMPSPWDERCLR